MLESAIERVHYLDVTSAYSLRLISTPLVQFLQLARLSHGSDTITCVVKFVSLGHGQVEVDLAIALEVVGLDSVAQEGQDFILNFVIVHQGFRAHRILLWETKLPLN